MSVVIKVENLSKQYRLGEVGTGAMKDDFKRWRYRMMGREDPFLKIGEENDRTVKSKSGYVWALKDINFEVKEGEILGVIGRNGAGKSTLLKILSRTTGPTLGSVKMKGRIASLLEVGTGFHGELSGRENIFLNGAIMGMRKYEIRSKLDEIVDFAGVEKYLDTPVKRYSSGMYVRLAFAVAAHLEPDILIVDEVLAVGDAEFQKKAIGKMKEVGTNNLRTVIFVSHNMIAVQGLCDRGIYLKNGTVQKVDAIDEVVGTYLKEAEKFENKLIVDNISGEYHELIKITKARCFSASQRIKISEAIYLEFHLASLGNIRIHLSLILKNTLNIVIFNVLSEMRTFSSGEYVAQLEIPPNLLNSGRYNIDLYVVDSEKMVSLFLVENILDFNVEDNRSVNWFGEWRGLIRPNLQFKIDEATSKQNVRRKN